MAFATPEADGRPGFYDPADFPFLAVFAARRDALQQEARALLRRLAMRSFWQAENPVSLPGVDGQWQQLHLDFCGLRFAVNDRLAPAAAALIDEIPGMLTAAYYVLGPRSHITPHRGIGPNVLRAHYGLICPEDCRFRVGDEERMWRNGEFLVFDDTLDHEAWNGSDHQRVIFHIDFFHPPEQDPALMAAQARVLRETNIRKLIAHHALMSAAGLRTDPDLMAQVEATVATLAATPDGRARLSQIQAYARTHGYLRG